MHTSLLPGALVLSQQLPVDVRDLVDQRRGLDFRGSHDSFDVSKLGIHLVETPAYVISKLGIHLVETPAYVISKLGIHLVETPVDVISKLADRVRGVGHVPEYMDRTTAPQLS